MTKFGAESCDSFLSEKLSNAKTYAALLAVDFNTIVFPVVIAGIRAEWFSGFCKSWSSMERLLTVSTKQVNNPNLRLRAALARAVRGGLAGTVRPLKLVATAFANVVKLLGFVFVVAVTRAKPLWLSRLAAKLFRAMFASVKGRWPEASKRAITAWLSLRHWLPASVAMMFGAAEVPTGCPWHRLKAVFTKVLSFDDNRFGHVQSPIKMNVSRAEPTVTSSRSARCIIPAFRPLFTE